MIEIIVASGIMAAICAYLMFKVKDSTLGVGLQALFFFMILANFIIIGSAGFEARNHCEYVLANSTVNMGTEYYNYELQCTEQNNAASSWVYRLPLFFAYISGFYIIIYMLVLIGKLFNRLKKNSEDRDYER